MTKSQFMREPRAEPNLFELCRGEARNRINPIFRIKKATFFQTTWNILTDQEKLTLIPILVRLAVRSTLTST